MKTNNVNRIPFESRIPVKVCQVQDKLSIYNTISAARLTNSDNVILGLPLFSGDTYIPEEYVRKNIPALKLIKEISHKLSQPVRTACVTNVDNAEDFINFIRQMGANVFDLFQISSNMPLADMQKVKSVFPQIKILAKFGLPVKADNTNDLLIRTLDYAQDNNIDGILLDSVNPSTGTLIDWNIAQKAIRLIHDKVSKPVGIAGGISPKNAKQALETTGADLLDANTGFKFTKDEWNGAEPIPKNPFAIMDVLNISKNYDTKFELFPNSKSLSFTGKFIPHKISTLSENSQNVEQVISTGTFAQIFKYAIDGKNYAIKRLYPNEIVQPQHGLVPMVHESLQTQLQKEIEVYTKLKGVSCVPNLYDYNIDYNNFSNNYIVTDWIDGKIATKNGAIYDTNLVNKKNLSKLFRILSEFDKKGVLHNDLWAGNILFTKSDVKLIDFNDAKIFNPQEQYKLTNINDFKLRFLNIMLSDVYHRFGKESFLKLYRRCLGFEKEYYTDKINFYKNNENAKKYYENKIKNIDTILHNEENFTKSAIKTIYDSNIYWAKMMQIRKTQGDYKYYLERAAKIRKENSDII